MDAMPDAPAGALASGRSVGRAPGFSGVAGGVEPQLLGLFIKRRELNGRVFGLIARQIQSNYRGFFKDRIGLKKFPKAGKGPAVFLGAMGAEQADNHRAGGSEILKSLLKPLEHRRNDLIGG